MNDQMNELTQFSPYAGQLVLETVPGETSRKVEHENDVNAADGADRSMYVYAPASGCPDPKQNQVLMVLRNCTCENSARKVMEELGLDKLAEKEHFLLLFPNPTEEGWNYDNDPARDSDIDFLIRCFGVLRQSKSGVGGFNGMVFYLAACPEASALMMTMAATRPLNVSAMMISSFPEEYGIPSCALNVETAACVLGNPAAEEYFRNANGVSCEEECGGFRLARGTNPEVRLLTGNCPLDADSVLAAWDILFSVSRRWQNDTYGTYQPRTAFTERGFVAHVKDSSLGVNNGFPHTWYEYIPPQLRGTQEKVPLVFYFHGVNCVPLYGAEQSNWHDVADKENFIVVYPAPAVMKAWNIYNDPSLPCDFDFVLALIEHMKEVHPIDETRIYATGFSMGSMMTQAITAVYPEVFAAGAPCNAFNFAYFKTPAQLLGGVVKGVDVSKLKDYSTQKMMADAKRAEKDFRMPLFHNAGYNDATIALWPVDETTDDARMQTIDYWKQINNIPTDNVLDPSTLTGLAADESFYEDAEERIYHQRWHSNDEGHPVLYELMTVKRMPHAILPVQIEYAWNFVKKFRRMPDGSLKIGE